MKEFGHIRIRRSTHYNKGLNVYINYTFRPPVGLANNRDSNAAGPLVLNTHWMEFSTLDNLGMK